MKRLGIAAVAGLALAAPLAAQGDTARAVRPRSTYEDLQMFSQVLNQIRVNHPDSIDTHDLFMAAIQGMVHAADPHSFVIQAARLSPEKQREYRAGHMYPVPIDFRFVGDQAVVASVGAGSDAARQDILPGDVLVSIDGRPVQAESPFELDVTLAGAKNSTVRLRFERERVDGSTVEVERVVKRERVEEGTAVPAAFMLDATTGYIRVTTFANEKAAEDMHAALGQLEHQGMQRLILDLRDNGGGMVDEAARVASEFLPTGAVIYSAEGRKAEIAKTQRVSHSFLGSGTGRQYPLVLLVDGGTASASEIVAGALQDHDRALIVGRPTFGKSLLMQGFPMTDGSIIELVIGHVLTPCGRVIQRQYHGMARGEYYRLAHAARDTAGRPSCKTDHGRTVYGGGGIYPDVVLQPEEGTPVWLARLYEEEVVTRWTNAWLGAHPDGLGTVEAFAAAPQLPAGALADFRAFAQRNGQTVPDGADADARLQRELVLDLAGTKWGAAGYYRVAAVLDPQVRQAVTQFPGAAQILGGQ